MCVYTKGKMKLRFSNKPVNKEMKLSRLKLLMTKLRAKNYLCFPRMDDPQFKNNFIDEVIILRDEAIKNSLALYARKKTSGKWDVWYEEDRHLIGNLF